MATKRWIHQADFPTYEVLRQPYLPYISSILQDRAISCKMVKLAKMVHVLLVWVGKIG